jgi:hypothetical protein
MPKNKTKLVMFPQTISTGEELQSLEGARVAPSLWSFLSLVRRY